MKILITVAMLLGATAHAQVYAPNALTVNSDNINEYFRVYTMDTLAYFNLQIFNVYGAKIFESSDPDFVWRPDYQYLAPTGVVLYALSWRPRRDVTAQFVRGHINIIQ